MDKREIETKTEPPAKDAQIDREEPVRHAEKPNISADELGNALNEAKIRVIHCQTGGLE